MAPAKHSLRVVIFKDGDMWVAQALERDLCAQGRDLKTVHARFLATLRAEIEHAMELGIEPLQNLDVAPERFQEMWKNRSPFSDKPNESAGLPVELALAA